MKTINDFNFENKKALIRVDFNVPLNKNYEVTDATRIEAARPTIIKILEDGGSCILMSHLGRPKGREAEFSLQHLLFAVDEILNGNANFGLLENLSSGAISLIRKLLEKNPQNRYTAAEALKHEWILENTHP